MNWAFKKVSAIDLPHEHANLQLGRSLRKASTYEPTDLPQFELLIKTYVVPLKYLEADISAAVNYLLLPYNSIH